MEVITNVNSHFIGTSIKLCSRTGESKGSGGSPGRIEELEVCLDQQYAGMGTERSLVSSEFQGLRLSEWRGTQLGDVIRLDPVRDSEHLLTLLESSSSTDNQPQP